VKKLLVVALLVGCPGEPDPPAVTGPSFPADYAMTFKEVRNCRQSGEHDLNRVRILADAAAFGPYSKRDQPFPVGAVVLKEEFDIADTNCTGPIKQWTVMKRLAKGSAPKTLDWAWEQVDTKRNVVGRDTPRCIGCHTGCTPAENGYENTCAVP
jgi:hypothetical protein